jgi:hypothetical protein
MDYGTAIDSLLYRAAKARSAALEEQAHIASL